MYSLSQGFSQIRFKDLRRLNFLFDRLARFHGVRVSRDGNLHSVNYLPGITIWMSQGGLKIHVRTWSAVS